MILRNGAETIASRDDVYYLPFPSSLVGIAKLNEFGPFLLHTRTDGSDKGRSVGTVVIVIVVA